MATLRQDLERRRATVTRALQTNMRSTRERGAIARVEAAKDPYGSASSAHDDELAAITMDRLAHDLKQIEDALPVATRCIDCQAQLERLPRAA